MYRDTQTPQLLYPPPSLISISPPPPLYTPASPPTFLALLKDLLALLLHALLSPFSTKLVPCHPSHPYALELFPAPSSTAAIVPVRKERRSRSKSPSASPSSMTLTEGTLEDPRQRRTGVERPGFDIPRVRIRGAKGKGGVASKHEAWAKEAFNL